MLQFLANGICIGSIYSLIALGFGLIYYSTGIFHLAHGAIYTLAAYVAYFLFVPCQLGTTGAVIGALFAAACVGLAAEWIVYRPLRRSASAAVVLISSLGLYIVVVNIITLLAGNEPKILRPGIEKVISFGSVVLTQIQIVQVLVAAAVVFSYWMLLSRTRLGRLCRAMADDPGLLSVLGVNEYRLRLFIFAGGSILAGLGGVLAALDVGIDPQVGMSAVLTAAVACIIGGMGCFFAPAVGALLLGLLQNLTVWQTSANWQQPVTFILLIGFLLLRPQGLFNVRRRLEEI